MISVRHYCGATFQVSDGQEGNHVLCPGCRDMVRVPHAAGAAGSGNEAGPRPAWTADYVDSNSPGSDGERYVPEGGRGKRNFRDPAPNGDGLMKVGEANVAQPNPEVPDRSENLFNMFFDRYQPAYSAARRLDLFGRILLGLAFLAAVVGAGLLFLGLGSLKKAGGADGFAFGLVFGPYLLAAAAALVAAGAAARLKASLIRTQVDAALFVAPGLSAQDKISLAFSKRV